LEAVRRKYFEMFWYTHHLFIVFFGGLLMHGSFCFIKGSLC
jgi:NADPH oxidase